MGTHKIQELLPSGFRIPTLPDVVLEIQQLIADPDCGIREIGEVVARDAPLLAKVLKTANSAFYGLAGRCTSAEHACTVLGARLVGNIAMHVGVFQALEHLKDVVDAREIWEHSARVAGLCTFLTSRVMYRRKLDPSDFHTYGLLHDLGKIVLLDALGDSYASLMGQARRGGAELIDVEFSELGFHHAQVGAYVANYWSLPEAIRNPLLYHHGPIEEIARDPAVAIVYASNRLANAAATLPPESLLAMLEEPAIATLGLTEEHAREVVDYARGRLTNEAASPFDEGDSSDTEN